LPTQHPVTQVPHAPALHSTRTSVRDLSALVTRDGNNHLHRYGRSVTEPRWFVALQHDAQHRDVARWRRRAESV